jgi:tryptophan-rich sensory protein
VQAIDNSVFIGGTAIRFSDLGTVALPLPSTHDDIRELIEQGHGRRAGKHVGEVGYVTSQGRFVRPREAFIIARDARQLKHKPVRGDEAEFAKLIKPLKRDPDAAAPRRAKRTARSPVNAMATGDQIRGDLVKAARVAVAISLVAGILSFWLAAPVLQSGWAQAMGPATAAWAPLLVQIAISGLGGLGFALVLHARGSRLRGGAVASFAALLTLGCLWAGAAGAGMGAPAAGLLAMLFPLALITFSLFGKVRPAAAALMMLHVPWLGLMGYGMAAAGLA